MTPPTHASARLSPLYDRPVSPRKYADVSLLLVMAQAVVSVIWFLNLIEYWKALLVATASDRATGFYRRSLAIDTYILFKWAVLLWLLVTGPGGLVGYWVVAYLICSATFSYFYYHVWKRPGRTYSHARQLRRTVAFVLSFFFGIAGFAYLFASGYPTQIAWPVGGTVTMEDALLLSLSNAFTSGFAAYEPLTRSARWILALENLFVFTFLIIVVVNSFPTRSEDPT